MAAIRASRQANLRAFTDRDYAPPDGPPAATVERCTPVGRETPSKSSQRATIEGRNPCKSLEWRGLARPFRRRRSRPDSVRTSWQHSLPAQEGVAGTGNTTEGEREMQQTG